MREHIEQVKAQSEQWRPEEVLRWAFSTFRQDMAIASGGGVEGMVLLDIACSSARSRSRTASSMRPHRTYAAPKDRASREKRNGRSASSQRPAARSSSGNAWCRAPWRR